MSTPLEDATWAEYWEAFYHLSRFGWVPLLTDPDTGDELTHAELVARHIVTMDAYNAAREAAEAE